MAGKAKSCYLTVTTRSNHKSVLSRMFFKMADLNDYIRTDEFKLKYPDDLYQVIKEVY